MLTKIKCSILHTHTHTDDDDDDDDDKYIYNSSAINFIVEEAPPWGPRRVFRRRTIVRVFGRLLLPPFFYQWNTTNYRADPVAICTERGAHDDRQTATFRRGFQRFSRK